MEGTTLGDPLTMAMHTLAVTPNSFSMSEISQVQYIDNATAAGPSLSSDSWPV